MSDRFSCLSLAQLLTWINREEKTGKIFGIPKSLFFHPAKDDVFRMQRYGKILETPLGVAAGPHTQLSQNIVSAWLTGARYIELKTVQVLDELCVTKPCISMADEGYNCEWSQELKLEQSLDEYVNALVAIHILRKRLHKDAKLSEPGFIFNMSVGYNLEGILSPTVQKFLDGMADSSDKISQKLDLAKTIFPEAADLDIPCVVSDNVTISTMHGCPPDEIEKIGAYFIGERNLNTTIKLNPTLLGAADLRKILNHDLGFDVNVPDIAFEHDLKYDAGVNLIHTLLEKARSSGVEFNLKLTNTLETRNNKSLLPDNEPMVYMSGRPLHVISVNLASKLQQDFHGELDISFSAGVDCFNFSDVLSCGLKPVTVCSDILKPGGYGRLTQYLSNAKEAFSVLGAATIEEYILTKADNTENEKQAARLNLEAYATQIKDDRHYQKKSFPWDSIKTKRKLDPFDCIHAPCKGTCPAGQDVPSYMYYTSQGRFEDAYRAILQTNPFPNVQGLVCDHPCTDKCTRLNYDEPLKIREIKRFITQNSPVVPQIKPLSNNGRTAAVIGGGPSGFSAAYFLKMNGFSVDLFEAKPFGGGMAADAIPSFRLDDLSIQKDIDRIVSLGVTVHYEHPVDQDRFKQIKDQFDYVYIGVGASIAYPLEVPGADAEGVYDQLRFLSCIRQGKSIKTGNAFVVIGGGNSAMDAARAAKRLAGKDGCTTILYRRGIEQMPADLEEIQDVQKENINIMEMVAPKRVITKKGKIKGIQCYQIELGEPDESGRPRPVIVPGSEFTVKADTIISAIGQKVVVPFWTEENFKVNPVTFETNVKNVYAGGDAIRGASTLIKAIADGQKAVKQMTIDAKLENSIFSQPDDQTTHQGINQRVKIDVKTSMLEEKITKRLYGQGLYGHGGSTAIGFELETPVMTKEWAMKEALRCLSCDTLCNICTTVCPNRANISYGAEPFKCAVFLLKIRNGETTIEKNGFFAITQTYQVINIHDFCNECGNCTTFCPSSGSPYQDKPTFYLSQTDFDMAESGYRLDKNTIYKRIKNKTISLTENRDHYLFSEDNLMVKLNKHTFEIIDTTYVVNKNTISQDIHMDLYDAAELGFLYTSLKDIL